MKVEGTRLADDIARKRVVVCVGSGGVGKTTTSAVIALHAAIEGRRVLVLTVDPAKRLANSLGAGALDDEERQIPIETFKEIGIEPKGELHAMMLDMKHAFDRLIEHNAPDAETRERILANRFYKYFSTSLAGTQEYSAMERLYELYEETDYDLIVLDTPPTAHALDFLEAPNRLFEALDSSAFDWIVKGNRGTRLGLGLFKLGAGYAMKMISKFTGANFLSELAEFISSFGSMWEGFKERAARTREIMAGDAVSFFVVAGPDTVSLSEANVLFDRLENEDIDVGGFIINRVHQTFVPQPVLQANAAELQKRLAEALNKANPDTKIDADDLLELSEKMQRNAREFHVLANRDQEQLQILERDLEKGGHGDIPIRTVPFFSTDIYSFKGLDRIRRELFGLTRELAPAQRTPGRL